MNANSQMSIRYLEAFVLALFFGCVFLVSLLPISSNDFWWNLKVGEWIWQNQRLLESDVFSHTIQGAAWVNHEVGSQLLLYVLYRLGGLDGVRIFVAYGAVFIAMVVFLGVGGRKSRLFGLLFAALAVFLAFPRLSPRPSLLNVLFLPILPWLWSWVSSNFQRRRVFLLFFIHLVWINFHPEGLIAIFFTSGYFCVEGIYSSNRRKKYLLLSAFLPLLALCQPHGWHLLNLILSDTQESMGRIHEWRPTLSAFLWSGNWRVLGSLGFGLGFILLSLFQNRNKFPWSERLVAIAAFILALTAAREVAWGILSLVIVGRRFGPIYGQMFGKPMLRGGVVLLVFACLPWKNFSINSWATSVREDRFPIQQVEFMKESHLEGNLFNFYDNGGYVLFHLYPKCKVFIDSRNNPYPRKIKYDHDLILRGGSNAQKLLDQYAIDLLLIRANYFSDPQNNPHWLRIFSDGQYDVYLRKNVHNLENLEKVKKYYVERAS